MVKLKSKLHYYLAEKNWGVKREYVPYIKAHKDKYEGHRIRRLWLLFRLNWHYRVLRSREWLLPLSQVKNIEDVAYRLPPVLTDSVVPKRYEAVFLAYRAANSNGGAGAVNAMCQKILGSALDGIRLKYYYSVNINYPQHLEREIKNYKWSTQIVFKAAYYVQNKLNIWFICNKKNDVFFVCHDIGSAYGVYLCGKKYVLVYHQQGSLVNEISAAGEELYDDEKNILNKVEEIVMNAAQTVYFPSDGAKQEYLNTCGFDYSKVNFSKPLYNTVLPCLQNLNLETIRKKFGIPKNDRENYQIFLTAGDYNLNKGIDRIPSILNEYAKTTPKKVIWIAAGNRHKTGIFETLQNEKNNWLFEAKLFGDRIPHEKILALMELCDFYIMLHRKSIFDLSTLEAMRAGLIPVLSNVGGNPEFNKENNVVLIEPENIDESINKIMSINFSDYKERNKQVFEGYFSNKKFAQAYTSMIYDELEKIQASPRFKSSINKNNLANFKNKYAGETVVICGNGESLCDYEPIAGARHIALNRALFYENVKFDMHFMQDYPKLDTEHTMDDYKNYDCNKFYGIITNPELSFMGFENEEFNDCKGNVYRYELTPRCFDRSIDNYEFELDKYCLADGQSVLFSALQFAVFAGFKKILLVGIDFSNTNYDSRENKSVYAQAVVGNLLCFKHKLRMFDETVDLNVIKTTNELLEKGLGKYDDVITVTGFYTDLYKSSYQLFKKSCIDNYRFDFHYVDSKEWEETRTDTDKSWFLGGNTLQTKVVIEKIKKYWGGVLILSDADNVFLKRTEEELRTELGDKDILFLRERNDINNLYERAKANVNIGFVLIRCNENSLHFWETVDQRVRERRGWNQEEVNILLLENPNIIKWGFLSTLFLNGYDVTKENVLHQMICTSCGTVASHYKLSKGDFLQEIINMSNGKRNVWFDGSKISEGAKC